MSRAKADASVRFWAKVNKDGPMCEVLNSRCWLWTAGTWRSRQGSLYGQFTLPDGTYYHVGYFADIADAEAAVIARRSELFTHNDLDRVTI
jgi:hypothetical protein